MLPSLREQTDSGPGVMKRETVCEVWGKRGGCKCSLTVSGSAGVHLSIPSAVCPHV